MKQSIQTDDSSWDKTDAEVFLLFFSRTWGEYDSENQESEVHIPPVKLLSISKPEIWIEILIDTIGNKSPSKKDAQEYEMSIYEPFCPKKEDGSERYKSQEKEHLHFLKTH